jgi:predicted dinucleotide-utilizing enzyme
MPKERHVDALLKRLVLAIEASLAATEAARDAVQEILKRGADTGIFFAGAKSRGAFSSELTPQDKEFLRAVSIKPER